jgi:hypothetical protein
MDAKGIDRAERSQALPAPQKIYVSSPLDLYGSARLDAAVQALRVEYSGAVLLLPSQLFRNRRDWLERGQAVLRQITRLVVVTGDDAWIGRGVWSEVATVLRLGHPAFWCPAPGTIVPWNEVACSPPDESNWTRYTRLTRREGP